MTSYSLGDTIVAIATSPARGALGIVRLSGPAAWRIARAVTPGLPARMHAQRAYVRLACLESTAGDVIETTCVVLPWRAPLTYTGEDMAELSLHGSPALLDLAVQACLAAGARQAEAGEFTYRAYLNGKLDLAQAEAVQDLINADSAQALRLAASALSGAASAHVREWTQALEALLAEIEVFHDYAASDLDASVDAATIARPDKLLESLRTLLSQLEVAEDTARRTAPLREGITVALCGSPNAGKSTLFNALVGHARALTAPQPGTTRDYITAATEERGLRITFVDTAGMHEARDPLEASGVELAAEWGRTADYVWWIEAADHPMPAPPALAGEHLWRVISRCDLLPEWPVLSPGAFAVSGLTGQGVPELRQALVALVLATASEPARAGFTMRQAGAIGKAAAYIRAACSALSERTPLDAVAMDINAARLALQGLYEQQDRDAVIAQIFSRFCVGK
jgi:tRNA modification GTPase